MRAQLRGKHQGVGEGGAALARGLEWTTACSVYHAQTFCHTRKTYRILTLNCFCPNNTPNKSFTCTVHTCAKPCHGASRTCLRSRTPVYMTLFTLREHVRTVTNPHGEAPFVAVTKGKSLCAVVVPRQPSLFDGCCSCCCALKKSIMQRCKYSKRFTTIVTMYTACTAVYVPELSTVSHVRV